MQPGGTLLQLLRNFDSLAHESSAEGLRVAREMELKEEPIVRVELPLQAFAWGDSVLCISGIELKAQRFALQSYVPAGLKAERVFVPEPPNAESKLIAVHVVPLTSRNALVVLCK